MHALPRLLPFLRPQDDLPAPGGPSAATSAAAAAASDGSGGGSLEAASNALERRRADAMARETALQQQALALQMRVARAAAYEKHSKAQQVQACAWLLRNIQAR